MTDIIPPTPPEFRFDLSIRNGRLRSYVDLPIAKLLVWGGCISSAIGAAVAFIAPHLH